MPTIGESPRMQALKKMSASFPAANQQAAQGQQAARQIQLQQQVAQAPQGMGVRAAQATGAQQAQQAGQIAVDTAKKGQAEQIQLGQLGLQERGTQLRGAQAQSELAASQEQFETGEKLAKLGNEIKQELFDKQMEFKQDELGRTQFNNRQMVDWAISKAKSAEEFKDYQQKAQQALERKSQIMKIASQKVEQALQQEFMRAEQEKDHELKKQLQQMMAAHQQAKQNAENDINLKNAQWAAGTAIIGAGIKAFAGA